MEPKPTQQSTGKPLTSQECDTQKEKTTIQICKNTAEKLTNHKHGRDTYDDVIIRHMDHWDKYNPS